MKYVKKGSRSIPDQIYGKNLKYELKQKIFLIDQQIARHFVHFIECLY